MPKKAPEKIGSVLRVPLSQLHPHPQNPFAVRDDSAMQELKESVSQNGVLVPAIARPRAEGGYELIAGHRRKYACEQAALANFWFNNLDQNALLSKISKIILFDDVHASSAWEVLNEFTEIPVERILLQRVKEDKSFLDIRLSVGVCKEFCQNQIDSFILASSDSDYWGLIPTLEEARFLVLVEEEKVSGAIRHTLEDAGITYCYLDDFCTGNSNQIKERALLKELRQRLEEEVNFNIRDILREVYEVTRADMAAGEKDQFYARYIKPMHIEIDQDGEVYLRLGEK